MVLQCISILRTQSHFIHKIIYSADDLFLVLKLWITEFIKNCGKDNIIIQRIFEF